jgi:hypothetical protein
VHDQDRDYNRDQDRGSRLTVGSIICGSRTAERKQKRSAGGAIRWCRVARVDGLPCWELSVAVAVGNIEIVAEHRIVCGRRPNKRLSRWLSRYDTRPLGAVSPCARGACLWLAALPVLAPGAASSVGTCACGNVVMW